MIQAVSSLKVGNSKEVFFNYQRNNNYMSSNINHSANTFSKSKSISFKGNLASEAVEITKKIAKELPPVKKSLIVAVSDLIHEIGDTGVTVTIPLPEIDVAKPVIAGARDIIVPHVADLASEVAKEGVSAAGHEAAGAIAEGAGTAIKENAGHGVIEGAKEAGHGLWEGIKEAISHIF